MFAIVETGGKQYRVQEGDVITVEKLNVEAGEKIVFDKVLMLSDSETGATCCPTGPTASWTSRTPRPPSRAS